MSFDSIYDLGKQEAEKEIVKGLKIKIRTLTAVEYAKVMKLAGALAKSLEKPDLTTVGELAEVQIETLAHATVSVNGVECSGPDRYDKQKAMYQNMQYPVMIEAYKVYSELQPSQASLLEELKKN